MRSLRMMSWRVKVEGRLKQLGSSLRQEEDRSMLRSLRLIVRWAMRAAVSWRVMSNRRVSLAGTST
jgi:hypothetical protein